MSELKGCLAAASVYIIYGIGTTFIKDILDTGIVSPSMLFTVRTAGAALLFWAVSLFVPGSRLGIRELPAVAGAALLGLIIPQYCTVYGMTMSTPYDASLISTLKPVATFFVAVLLGSERFRLRTSAGVALAFAGAVVLVGTGTREFNTSLPGLLLLLLNVFSFAFYLVLCRPLIRRSRTIPLMKWMFLIAFLVSVPFSFRDFASAGNVELSTVTVCELAFLVVLATFTTFFLMPIGQRHLKATQYSLFSYVQCLTAAVVAVFMGLDCITWQKVVATVLFVAGSLLCRQSTGPGEKAGRCLL